jgi:hypothetical protein
MFQYFQPLLIDAEWLIGYKIASYRGVLVLLKVMMS